MIRYSFMIIDPLSALGADDDIRRFFDLLKSCGYEGVELNLHNPLGVDVDRLQEWVAAAGLVVPSFLTGTAYHEGLCLSSPAPEAHQGAVDRLIQNLDLGERFNALLVVGLLQGFRSDEPDEDIANARIADGLRAVARIAEAKGVDLVIEPVNHLQVGFNNSVGEVRRLVEAVGSPAVRPMVDTIHMNVEETSLTQPILDCGPQLRHVHLCESNGALFGSGNIDFGVVLQTLAAIDYDGFASVKVYRKATLEEAAKTSLEYLRQSAG